MTLFFLTDSDNSFHLDFYKDYFVIICIDKDEKSYNSTSKTPLGDLTGWNSKLKADYIKAIVDSGLAVITSDGLLFWNDITHKF